MPQKTMCVEYVRIVQDNLNTPGRDLVEGRGQVYLAAGRVPFHAQTWELVEHGPTNY